MPFTTKPNGAPVAPDTASHAMQTDGSGLAAAQRADARETGAEQGRRDRLGNAGDLKREEGAGERQIAVAGGQRGLVDQGDWGTASGWPGVRDGRVDGVYSLQLSHRRQKERSGNDG